MNFRVQYNRWKDIVKSFFARMFRGKKVAASPAGRMTIAMPPVVNAPVMKRHGTRMGKGGKRFFVPRSDKKRGQLQYHGGQCRPINPLVGDRRKVV